MYCKIQESPIASNVIVPVPEVFHPAFVTVITMLPLVAFIINVFICPSSPAANVAVSAALVVK
jgi:hypothetical protein